MLEIAVVFALRFPARASGVPGVVPLRGLNGKPVRVRPGTFRTNPTQSYRNAGTAPATVGELRRITRPLRPRRGKAIRPVHSILASPETGLSLRLGIAEGGVRQTNFRLSSSLVSFVLLLAVGSRAGVHAEGERTDEKKYLPCSNGDPVNLYC